MRRRWWGQATVTWITHLHLDKMAATFTDDVLKRIYLNENIRMPIQFSLKFVPKSPIDNTLALV